MKLHFDCLLVLLLSSGTASVLAEMPKITQTELVRRTQELYDAVVPGDQTPWRKFYSDDCLFHDEKGRSLDKKALVADITPLPKGYSGTIKISSPQSVISDDTAVLSYDAIETETIFGQELHARYHMTDTWLRRDEQWQIVASQAMRYYEDPAVGPSDPKKYAAYIGTYEVAKESERKTIISRQGDRLFLERGSRRVELFPESGDLFFRKGVEGRILFRFGKEGRVDALIDRRNNEDVVWRKLD